MICERSEELLEILVGGAVPPADVGVEQEDARALESHVATCGACERLRDELVETAAAVSVALHAVGERSADAFAADVLARIPPRRRVLPLRRLAAAAVVAAAVGTGWWIAQRTPTADEIAIARYPLRPPPVADYDGPRFTDVTESAGIAARNHTGQGDGKDWMIEVVGHGAAVLDMDGDGDLDLFVPDGNRVDPESRVSDTWRLFRNEGGMRFTDVTARSGLQSDAWAGGAVAGDVDADGRPDLFVPCYGHNRLFLNRGDGRFEDVSEAAGVLGADDAWSTAAAMGDLDGDGDLDIYVANYADMRRFMREAGVGRSCTWRSMPVPCGPEPLRPQRDRLLLNNGDGTFVDATDERLPRVGRYSFQPIILDLDGNGSLDVYVAADGHPNVLLQNDGEGRFHDIALVAGVATSGDGHEQASMGVAGGDFDGDGLVDLLVTNFSHEPNTLYRGRRSQAGLASFSDASDGAEITAPTSMTLGWGTALFDYDSDGDLDAVMANGHLYPDVEATLVGTTYQQHIALFRNDGAGRFAEVSTSAGDALVRPRVHRGLVAADFDDDGNCDLFVTVLNDRARLLRNDGRSAGTSVRVLLRRRDGRQEAAGASVSARIGPAAPGGAERTVVRHLLLGSSFGCSEDPRISFGLAAGDRARAVTVRWPWGDAEAFGDLEAGATYELVEGTGVARRVR